MKAHADKPLLLVSAKMIVLFYDPIFQDSWQNTPVCVQLVRKTLSKFSHEDVQVIKISVLYTVQ